MLLKIFLKSKYNYIKNSIPIIDLWLITELLPALLLFIIGFIIFSMSLGTLLYLIQQLFLTSLSLTGLLQIIIYELPGYIAISIPMSCLLTHLTIFSRLREKNELLALKALGVSTRRILVPVLFIGIISSIITFSLTNLVAPAANRASDLTLRSELGVTNDINMSNQIQYSNFIPDKDNKNSRLIHLFYAEIFENNQMNGVTLIDYTNKNYTKLISAKKAYLDDKKNQWVFLDGTIVMQAIDKSSEMIKESFIEYSLNPGVLGEGPIKMANIPKDSNNMSLFESFKSEKLYREAGNIKELRKIKVRIQEKFTFPLTCVIFSFTGAIIGSIKTRNLNQSQAFGISIMIIIIYYTLAFIFSSLGVSGVLNPMVSAWSPVFFVSFIGDFYLKKIE
tara:strand:- start:7669 stop:8844 length:1176 start_codon:yes stop_codon:yes gene_type:complete